MNKNEYWNTNGRQNPTEQYKYVQKQLRRWKMENGYTCRCIVHHRDDNDDVRNYNNLHYELWGFNEDGTFEYGKYVVFMTHPDHTRYHNKTRTYHKGSESLLYGKKLSEEHRKHLSENHADVSGDKNPFYGKHHSDAVMEQIKTYHHNTSVAWHNYKRSGGTLQWCEFRHAIKVGIININSLI